MPENKEFKYKTSFASKIKCIIRDENDPFLSKASLDYIRDVIPEKYRVDDLLLSDLLPIAFNGAVVGYANKNGDVIDKETALAVYKYFNDKYLDLDHNADNIVGHIVNVGFSEFGTNKILSEEETTKLDIFNLVIAAVIYTAIPKNDKLIDAIEDSTDPSSDLYESISGSWEVGFNDFDIIVGPKDISRGSIITDEELKKKYEKMLKVNGGKGIDEDGNYITRRLKGTVLPMGFGLVTNPAAEVKGIAVASNIIEPDKKDKNNFSHLEDSNVKQNIVINMKFQNLDELQTVLASENVKPESIASVKTFIVEHLAEKSKEWAEERKSKEEALASEKAERDRLQKELDEIKNSAANLQKEFDQLKAEQEKIVAMELLSSRMAEFEKDYDLDDEDRQILAEDLKDMSDESFAKYKDKMGKLMKNKKKAQMSDDDKNKMHNSNCNDKSKASDINKDNVIDDALSKAKQTDKNDVVINSVANETFAEKWKKTFKVSVNNKEFIVK